MEAEFHGPNRSFLADDTVEIGKLRRRLKWNVL
jgi:hypothetical protein